MTPKELRDLAAERREKLGNKETRLSKALDDAADKIERLLSVCKDKAELLRHADADLERLRAQPLMPSKGTER